MEHLRIIRDIDMKQIRPMYFFMGEEPFFIDLLSDYIEENVLDESAKTFGLSIVYGRDVSMDQVLSVAKSFPMMGERQVVIVKEAQDMKEWKKEEENKALEAYLLHPTPTTMLVFCYKHKTLDKRKKLYKVIEKHGVTFISDRIKDYQLPKWIDTYVKQKGFGIQEKALHMLAEYLGADLGKVVNEINKLGVILSPRATITPKHIEDNIGISKDYNVWELQSSLAHKDVLKSNRIINYFEANPKANPIQMVIPSLYSFFLKLAMYQSLPDKGSAQKVLGMSDYALKDIKMATPKFSDAKVEKIISYLRETDRKSKGVDNYSTTHGDLMKELVFKILH